MNHFVPIGPTFFQQEDSTLAVFVDVLDLSGAGVDVRAVDDEALEFVDVVVIHGFSEGEFLGEYVGNPDFVDADVRIGRNDGTSCVIHSLAWMVGEGGRGREDVDVREEIWALDWHESCQGNNHYGNLSLILWRID